MAVSGDMGLEGLILFSREFGYCKITAHIDQRVRLRFCTSQREAWYNGAAIRNRKDFTWQPLPAGLKCEVQGRGVCVIKVAPLAASKTSGVHEYSVEFQNDSRDTAVLSERDLSPIPGSLSETPVTRIASLASDPISHFIAREKFRAALHQQHRETAGIQSLASSRIDLLPHQAFVVGTVVDDPVWRYVLADEVGLGKTVEAGAIAHQLLSVNPGARVLALCPGPLARQWLCEMHTSFGGSDFHLADLHMPQAVRWGDWTRMISSLKAAMLHHREVIETLHWDLIIVDEAHHLLWNEAHYGFVKRLSTTAGGVLLLSAIPARERESDLLRLLQLVVPQHYAPDSTAAAHFAELYATQPMIGRRLRILGRALDTSDDVTVNELKEAAERLLACPVVRDDVSLAATYGSITGGAISEALPALRQLRDDVISRYRISRRIIKNRRTRLVDGELLSPVERRLRLVQYSERPLERDISTTLQAILTELAHTDVHRGCLHGFVRKSVPSLCDPVAAFEIADSLQSALPSRVEFTKVRHFDSGLILDYEEHDALIEFLSEVLRPRVATELIEQLVNSLANWIEDVAHQPRFDALVAALGELQGRGLRKVVIFAGTFRTCEYLENSLAKRFSRESSAIFRHDQSDEEKEKSVTRFRRSPECTFLISDESGGEGRNFQFADAIIHYDLPWSVAAVEQRIGRLDRIGRTAPVESVVVVPRDTLEWAWASCLATGFKVFEQSISGLEFTLRTAESEVIEAALTNGSQGVLDCIEGIGKRCERERAADDADAITDASSFRKESRYLRPSTAIAEQLLEEGLPSYFRCVSRSEAASLVADKKEPNLKVWRLKPEQVSGTTLEGLYRSSNTGLQDHIGTFSRSVARARRDLEFFSTGNALFDAITKVSAEHVRGRNYAAQLAVDDIAAASYLVATMTPSVQPSNHPIGVDGGIARAERHLFGRRVHCAINLNSGEILSRESASKLHAACSRSDASVRDLSKDYLMKAFADLLDDWPRIVGQRLSEIRIWVEEESTRRFESADKEFVHLLQEERRDAARLISGDVGDLDVALQTCIGAVRGVRFQFDSIGVVINVNRRLA